MQEFFYMDGYWLYVWSAYGLGCIVLLAVYLAVRAKKRRVLDGLARRARRESDDHSATE